MAVADQRGRLTACNAQFCKLVDHSKTELIGSMLGDLIQVNEVQQFRSALAELTSGRVPYAALDLRFIVQAGELKACRVHIFSMQETEDQPVQALLLIEEVSGESTAKERVAESQMLLKMAGRTARLGGWSFDNRSQELLWSDETCEIHEVPAGYNPTLGEGVAFYLPEYRPMIAATVQRCLSDGIPFDFEAELVTARQKRIWVRAIGEAIFDSQKEIIGFQGAFQDITLQRASAAERNALAIRLSNTLRDMSDSFFTLDKNWRITYVNDAMLKTVGRSRDELINRLMWDAFPGTQNSRFHQCYEQALATRSVATLVEYYEPLEKWFDLRVYPAEDGVAIYFQDVTKKRHDDEQLRLLQTCVERMNDIVVISEGEAMDGGPPRVLYVNDAFERQTGFRADEIIGKTAKILQGPGTQRDVLDRIRANLKTWTPIREEVLNYTKSGDELWLELEILPIADANGWYTHWIAIERNITERKRADEELRKKVDLLRVGGRVGKFGGWTAMPSSNALQWTDEIYWMLDWPKATPPTMTDFYSMFTLESRTAFQDLLAECLAHRSTFDQEFKLTTRSGVQKWVRIAAEVVEGGADQPNAVHGALQDISALKEVEERLREQAELLDKAQDAIWVLGLDASVEFWNSSAERIYGWSLADVKRLGAKQILSQNMESFDRCFQAVMEHGEWVGEIELANRSGSKLLLVSRWTLVRDELGKPRSILAINTDITLQRQMEQQFLRAQRMESIGTLAGGIAHDLNNVLAPILMSIELLKDAVSDPQDHAVLRTVEVSAKRGADMVKQVLSFARGFDGQRHQVSLHDVVKDLEYMLNETIPKNILIERDLAPDLWGVQADPTQIQQVLLNLCVNARDAMPQGGRISIRADNLLVDKHYAAMNIEAREGCYLKLELEDNGCGMPPGILERIFDPFFTTKPQGSGTGLGLATTQAIVKSHGGYIRAYSEMGKGTRFHIYLPASPTTVAPSDQLSKPPLPRGDGQLVLVVDDEAAIRHITRQTLEAFGYRVVVASNGAEALGVFAQQADEIELVLTDMMMPILDGPATILALRQIRPEVKIIGASGISQNGKVAQAVGAGVSHFLPKPYSAESMLRAIHEVLKP